MLRATRTYVILEVTPQVFQEIAAKLREAGYDHAFSEDDSVIDMQGIALRENGDE